MTYTGGCNCGAVTLEISAEPAWVRQCWCRQCQKIAAGGATNNALFATDAVQVSGKVRWWEYVAESGNTVGQGSCPACGTPIFGRNSGRQGSWVVRLGALDNAAHLSPATVIWTDEAPPWAMIDPALERFERQPPLPAPKES